jgi:hypothetical protein
MATVEFHFKQQNAWTMGPACPNVANQSNNPAPTTTPCVYIIHNETENTTYVGYADNAQHRWSSRWEVFHCLGIPRTYADKILCAYCIPESTAVISFEGKHGCEHLLIRAVVNGLLGVTSSTNTQLGSAFFSNTNVSQVRVYLPSDKWGKLEGRKQINIHGAY